ncbi:HAD hydrolase family protein [Streptomyces sp. NBC_01525]|uniref:Hydrolase n=1 Tax=Streptomyces benahoarensis TaxID=2595054 RepID=A0A553ZB46_9ACTN|nr:HAD hydrolase family protein [Streptomyces benahoarensis]TSB18662.1 hydrolase [Streptomyces benahoarensis]TSB38651.1 hydrolase [Streptomyces benahoarensis]
MTSATPSRSSVTGALPRLIATDLDGTLLHDDKTVSERTVAALAAAERAGVDVFFVTGRPARWMDVVSAHVHGHGLAICANGAAVVDLHRGRRFVEVSPLPLAAAREVVEALRSAAPGTSFAVERTGGIHYEPHYPPFHRDPAAVTAPAEKLLADDFDPPPGPAPTTLGAGDEVIAAPLGAPDAVPVGAQGAVPVGASDAGPPRTVSVIPGASAPGVVAGEIPTAGPGQPVLKLLAHHHEWEPDAFLALARRTAGTLASITRSSPTSLLEISGLGVSKAGTLARCCAERGIAPEEVTAFGDMPNDMEMLAWAGTSYAMANAHPDVLAVTTGRTASNNEDGVAAVIERLLGT